MLKHSSITSKRTHYTIARAAVTLFVLLPMLMCGTDAAPTITLHSSSPGIAAIAYRAASPAPTIIGAVLCAVIVSALAAPLLMMLVVATERRQGAA